MIMQSMYLQIRMSNCDWTDMEYKLFRAIEYARYGSIVANGFLQLRSLLTLPMLS